RHLRDIAVRVVHEAQLRHVLHRRVVQREVSAVAKLHDRDAGQRLRDRGPVIDRLLVDGAPGREILIALEGAMNRGAAADEHQTAADDAGVLDALVIEGGAVRPGVAAGRLKADREETESEKRAKHARMLSQRTRTYVVSGFSRTEPVRLRRTATGE